MDVQVKGKRYRSCDEVVDMLKDNFVGQIGMRIMQRRNQINYLKQKKQNKSL